MVNSPRRLEVVCTCTFCCLWGFFGWLGVWCGVFLLFVFQQSSEVRKQTSYRKETLPLLHLNSLPMLSYIFCIHIYSYALLSFFFLEFLLCSHSFSSLFPALFGSWELKDTAQTKHQILSFRQVLGLVIINVASTSFIASMSALTLLEELYC